MILNEDFLESFVLMCQVITKPARLKIIDQIGNNKVNVSDLHRQLHMPMSNLSNHLNDLYRSGILGKEKQGNYVYYYLKEPKLLQGLSRMQEILKSINSKRK